jgi:cell wall-associated NlpC family hydrolase
MGIKDQGVSAVAVGVLAVGVLFVWSGIRGASFTAGVQSIIKGQKPGDGVVNPIESAATPQGEATKLGGLGGAPAGSANAQILTIATAVAASPPGRRNYCWGGGHQTSPCQARCFDCSGFVSCILNKLGVMKGSMVTGEFMTWKGAETVPYAMRQPGDLLVTPTHIGIIVDSTRIINAACTACGPVKMSTYTNRKDLNKALIRRVKA